MQFYARAQFSDYIVIVYLICFSNTSFMWNSQNSMIMENSLYLLHLLKNYQMIIWLHI